MRRATSPERTPLLRHSNNGDTTGSSLEDSSNILGSVGTSYETSSKDSFATSFENLNALEIAAVCGAKKFLSQRVVQRIVESIWRGDIVFWETLSADSVKEAKVYDNK